MRNWRFREPLTDRDLRLSAWCDERGLTAIFDDDGQSSMTIERWIAGRIYASALDVSDDHYPEIWERREVQLRKIHADLLEFHRSDRQQR